MWGALILSAVQTLRFARNLQSEEFGFSALAFVGWLSIFSFMGGFSIGFATATINVGLSLILSLIHKRYRLPALFVMAVNLLLVSFMRGFFLEARIWLDVLLWIGLLISLYSIYISRRRADDKNLSFACLTSVAILFFLSLLANNSYSSALVLGLLSFVAGLGSLLVSKYHKWHLAILMVASFLWLWVGYLQISTGV